MGKIRTRILGIEGVEQKQKEEQRRRAQEKKAKRKVHLPGMKGGERLKAVEVDEESLKKMEKAKKIIAEEGAKVIATRKDAEKKQPKKIKTRSKKYLSNTTLVRPHASCTLTEAVRLLKKMKSANFDQSVELHLNVDQVGLKGEVNLPHPVGKSVRVAVADEKVLADIEKGKLEFDVLITHPSFMSRLVRFAKILGPKGLMPNPKAGTISEKPEEVVKKFSRGVLRWKTEPKFPLVHQMIGKISFEEKALVENTERFLDSVGQAHITSAFIKTTMSPSIKLDLRL